MNQIETEIELFELTNPVTIIQYLYKKKMTNIQYTLPRQDYLSIRIYTNKIQILYSSPSHLNIILFIHVIKSSHTIHTIGPEYHLQNENMENYLVNTLLQKHIFEHIDNETFGGIICSKLCQVLL